MSQSVRYQVFVSSTFTDLTEERAEVIQALWELDCIPTGMEAFLATNESQWQVIQKVIDECDYYVLIIGGRYGSITPEGISYTEKEYKYAKALGIPVLAFVHGDPESIPFGKSEKDATGKALLDAFRKGVMDEHPIRTWTNAQELGGLVSRSVSREIKVSPRPGWIRNSGSSNLELLEQINRITKENAELTNKINTQSGYEISADELENGTDEITLSGTAMVYPSGGSRYTDSQEIAWTSHTTWDEIFRALGPLLTQEATESTMDSALGEFMAFDPKVNLKAWAVRSTGVSSEALAEVIVQLRALGLVDKGMKKRAVSDRGRYWALTDKGERYLVGLLARRRK